MSKAQRIRELLKRDPRLLAEVIDDLVAHPPAIFHPWRPNITRIGYDDSLGRCFEAARVLAGRSAMVTVQPNTAGGFRGPWRVDARGLEEHPALAGLRKVGEGNNLPAAYWSVLNEVDRMLTAAGYTLVDHVFPDVVLGPWKQSSTWRWTRPVVNLGAGMHPYWTVHIESDPSGRFSWDVFDVPKAKSYPFGVAGTLDECKADADRALSSLGYNMARPTSFAPLEPRKPNSPLEPLSELPPGV